MKNKREFLKKVLVFINLLLFLLLIGYSIDKEESYQQNNTFFLKLAPVDPRSLLQGDYMVLNYEIITQILSNKELRDSLDYRGRIKVKIGKDKIAQLVSIESEKKDFLQNDEVYILYTFNGERIDIGIGSYLFQEGHGQKYQAARYSEIIYLKNGKLRIKKLLDENLNSL